jgi:hypothetical protein
MAFRIGNLLKAGFLRLIGQVEKSEWTSIVDDLKGLITRADVINNHFSTLNNKYPAIIESINTKLKPFKKTFNDIQGDVINIMGLDIERAGKIIKDIDPQTNAFLYNTARLVNDQVDNLYNPMIEQFVKQKRPDLGGIWEDLRELRKFYNDSYNIVNNIAKEYGLDVSLDYRLNYIPAEYAFNAKHRIYGVKKDPTGKEITELIWENPDNILDTKDLRNYISDIIQGKRKSIPEIVSKRQGEYNRLISQIEYEPVIPTEWETLLKPNVKQRIMRELGGVIEPLPLDEAIQRFKKSPSTINFPRELNELGYKLDFDELARHYLGRQRVKLMQALWNKFKDEILPAKLGVNYEVFKETSLFKSLEESWYRKIFPEGISPQYLRKMFETLGAENLYKNVIRPLIFRLPAVKYLALDMGNTIANALQLDMLLVGQLKNPENYQKALKVVSDLLKNKEVAQTILKSNTEAIVNNPFLEELFTIIDKKRFLQDYVGLSFTQLSTPKSLLERILDIASEKGLALFNRIEIHNRLTAYISGLLDEGVAPETISRIFQNKLTTLEKMIDSELRTKHFRAIDLSKKVNFIYDPFYNLPMEEWITKKFGDIGRASLVLRRFGWMALAETMLTKTPKEALKIFLHSAPMFLLTFGLSGLPLIGVVSIAGEATGALKLLDDFLSGRAKEWNTEQQYEKAKDIIKYGLIGNLTGIDVSRKIKVADVLLEDLFLRKPDEPLVPKLMKFFGGVHIQMVSDTFKRTHKEFYDFWGKDGVEKLAQMGIDYLTPMFVLNIIDGFKAQEKGRIDTPTGKIIPFKPTTAEVVGKAFGLPSIRMSKVFEDKINRIKEEMRLREQSSRIYTKIHSVLSEYNLYNQLYNQIITLPPHTSPEIKRLYRERLKQSLTGMFYTNQPELLRMKEQLQRGFMEYQKLYKDKDINEFINNYLKSVIEKGLK